MNPSFVFDIICTVAWILLTIHYARKGFLASIVQLCGSLFSLIGAQQFANWGSAEVFESFLAGSFRERIAENLAAGGAADLDMIAEQYAGFLPESFREPIVEACERTLDALLTDNAVILADTIVNDVLEPLIAPVISIVLFFIAFALLRMLVSFLVTVLGLVNRLPVIGTVNRWLGLATGGVASFMDIYLALCVVWALIIITGGGLSVLNDTLLEESIYYRVFGLINPFGA